MIKYVCDICGKELYKSDIKEYDLPTEYIECGKIISRKDHYDLCKKCEHEISNFIRRMKE